MLAAMPPHSPNRDEPVIRDRGDACPGALRLHAADDGRLARLRLPAGVLTPRQALVLADAADALGDGHLTITSRGNLELRGLPDTCGAELAALLRDAGLLPSDTHERVRNIVASPLSGLDGLGHGDVQLWARELDALLCATPWAARLSGRFLFALDDGRGDVRALGGDVTLVAEPGGLASVRVGDAAVRVRAADAPRAALACARGFLEVARGAWRVSELPDGVVVGAGACVAGVGVAVITEVAGAGAGDPEAGDPTAGPPVVPAVGRIGEALSLHVKFGRLSSVHLRALAGGTELRFTPWRGVVVLGASGLPADLPAATGLVADPRDPWIGVGACTGRPGCGKALADVRADAVAPPGALPVYFSGCARRCGHPRGTTWVDVVATGDGAYEVDGAPVPRTSPSPRTSLADAVAASRTTTR
ncbi:cobalamin biosynthesis protein CobG [Streptomyces sp. NPDC001941]|uniref:cobalamin biosynthesis protein CobG n=1 Tax=Streptomyces sp. NPDC001941 TaxID=3154659 RepID=UPI003328AF43